MSEAALLAPSAPLLMTVPRGDGHPVLVIPGYLGSDTHTIILRRYLSSRGYKTHGWLQGTNRGLSAAGGIETLHARLSEVFTRHDERKVSVIGWSLGGIFARRLAGIAPDKVRQVISLGSPIGAMTDYRTVPTTAIYSRTDSIVPHQIATEPETLFSENLEVVSSHAGLVVNPQVLYLLGQKLSQPEGQWQPLKSRAA